MNDSMFLNTEWHYDYAMQRAGKEINYVSEKGERNDLQECNEKQENEWNMYFLKWLNDKARHTLSLSM